MASDDEDFERQVRQTEGSLKDHVSVGALDAATAAAEMSSEGNDEHPSSKTPRKAVSASLGSGYEMASGTVASYPFGSLLVAGLLGGVVGWILRKHERNRRSGWARY